MAEVYGSVLGRDGGEGEAEREHIMTTTKIRNTLRNSIPDFSGFQFPYSVLRIPDFSITLAANGKRNCHKLSSSFAKH